MERGRGARGCAGVGGGAVAAAVLLSLSVENRQPTAAGGRVSVVFITKKKGAEGPLFYGFFSYYEEAIAIASAVAPTPL